MLQAHAYAEGGFSEMILEGEAGVGYGQPSRETFQMFKSKAKCYGVFFLYRIVFACHLMSDGTSLLLKCVIKLI